MGGRRRSRRQRKGPDSPGEGRSISPPDGRNVYRFLGFCTLLLLAVLLVYKPAWHGGLIWDDDQHVTRPDLQSWQGLYRIWFDLGATQQYYPLVHSAFWLEHRLWGDNTLGYHLMNIALHATAAMLAA